jgi:hypothetical protein
VNEWGLTPQEFISRFEKDPPVIRPEQLAIPGPPADLAGSEWKECVDLQDSLATLYREGNLADFRADPAASDGWAVWMPGSHHEWALQFPGSTFPTRALKGSWDVYAVVRVETGESGEGALFRAGVYHTAEPRLGIGVTVSWEGAGEGYRSHHLGRTALSPEQYIWVAPAANTAVSGIWVDRIYLVPATE